MRGRIRPVRGLAFLCFPPVHHHSRPHFNEVIIRVINGDIHRLHAHIILCPYRDATAFYPGICIHIHLYNLRRPEKVLHGHVLNITPRQAKLVVNGIPLLIRHGFRSPSVGILKVAPGALLIRRTLPGPLFRYLTQAGIAVTLIKHAQVPEFPGGPVRECVCVFLFHSVLF
jgi:hypothetical protein